jgi:hypothetical protein
MKQLEVISQLYSWLTEQPFVRSCKCECDHVTDGRTTLGLYLGPKLPHEGRTHQVAQADIVVHEDDRVVLIVEVDPDTNPKKILGVLFAAMLADNYTPSGEGADHGKRIADTVLLYVTVVPTKNGSQKQAQLEAINTGLAQFIANARLNIRSARVCYGHDEDSALEKAKELIRGYLAASQTISLTFSATPLASLQNGQVQGTARFNNDPPDLGALLQFWIDEGDVDEQTNTGQYLIRALDEDRPSERKLFPPDMEGVTW